MIIKVPYLPYGLHGLALRPFIFVKRGHDRIIPHELIHIEQQKRYGLINYCYKYITDKNFRYLMEYQAYSLGSKMTSIEANEKARGYLNW